MRAPRFFVRFTRWAAYLWLAGCLGFLALGIVLTLWPFPVAWPGPVPWSLQSDFVETPDGRILVCLRYFCEVRCYDRSGSFVRAYAFPKTAGTGLLAVRDDNVVYLYTIDYSERRTLYALDAKGELGFREAPRPGGLDFSNGTERSVFHCADGGTLERHGQTLVRRSAAGDVMFTRAEPWPVRVCALPWPGYLAFLAVFALWLGRRLAPVSDEPTSYTFDRPRRITAKDDGTRLRIAWRWFRPNHINAVFFCLVWSSFLAFWFGLGLQTDGAWFFVFFGTPFVVGDVIFLYVTLAHLLNRTVIKATPEFLTLRNGPLPWFGNRKLPADGLAQLYFQQDEKKKNETRSSYSIYALTRGGGRVGLVGELGRDQALFIVQSSGIGSKSRMVRWRLKSNKKPQARRSRRPRTPEAIDPPKEEQFHDFNPAWR
jgi:hypothetical protein